MEATELAEIMAKNPSLKIKGNATKTPLPRVSGKAEASQRVESTGRVFSVELPLPPKECSPNGRYHWGAKARAVREYREACGYLVRQQLGRRRVNTVTLEMDFYLCRKGEFYFPKDCDNALASVKAAVDSLKDSGIVTNDSKKFVSLGVARLHTTKAEHQGRTCLVITIRET